MPIPKTESIVDDLHAFLKGRLDDEAPGKTSTWIKSAVMTKQFGLNGEHELKTLLRRPFLKDTLRQRGIAYAWRGDFVYAYRIRDDASAPSSPVERKSTMQNGEVKLVPGVLNKVPSTSEPGTEHEVRLSKNGNVYCDCEGYAYRGHCSHIDATMKNVPMLKVLVVASIRNRIAHLKETLAKLDEE